jgi:hypothetical protein
LSIVLAAIQWLQLARFLCTIAPCLALAAAGIAKDEKELSLKNSTLQPRSLYDFVKIHHSTSSPLKPRGMATGQFLRHGASGDGELSSARLCDEVNECGPFDLERREIHFNLRGKCEPK